ncbi:tol-pal system protein YbgF [Pseudogemmobacter lacusdianii]|uniref:tol-pal system protein YbgF n=1 Tax=Pseudogemmobacter lacusdianii TaxID=3069608 RepID=UPI003593767E
MRFIFPLMALSLAAPIATSAGADTLADIKVQLGQLAADFNSLRAELSTTGSMASVGGGDALQRMDAIEAELSRLTARAEEIELRVNRVVSDGSNRIGDIEFRLCEATPGCDPMNMPATTPLGGGAGAAAPAASSQPAASTGGPELAMGEQADFDRAKEVLGQGDFRGAATLLETFTQSFPGGPLSQEAYFLRGEALSQLGETANAARAYLEAYSGDPQGRFAADSLLKLGQALGALGQTPEACVTMAEVTLQYPGSAAASQAPMAMQGLGCP